MARRVNIPDLAEKAGVSVSTIDRILNGRANVRAATAARVLAAAEELNFYALPTLRERLPAERQVIRLGFLLQQSQRSFYKTIADALTRAAAEAPDLVEVVVEHMDDLSPEAVSGRMLSLGAQVHALAVVSAQHPRISQAIETLAAAEVKTYALISELSAGCGVGYVGLDNWRFGRTAGWAISRLCRRPGRVGILIGNHRYRCQELNESGFRSYLREHGSDITVLEPVQTFEDKTIARDVTEQLLKREPDLAGLYVSGGGLAGALEALLAAGRGESIVTIGHELTNHTRTGLIENVLSLSLAHPVDRMATETIRRMTEDRKADLQPGKSVLNFDIFTPENI